MKDIQPADREGLSIVEACAISGIGRNGLYAAINSGKLRARKFGKRTIILRGELLDFLSALPTSAPADAAGI